MVEFTFRLIPHSNVENATATHTYLRCLFSQPSVATSLEVLRLCTVWSITLLPILKATYALAPHSLKIVKYWVVRCARLFLPDQRQGS